jgi:hypothetical protein
MSNLDNGVERKTRAKMANYHLDCEWGFDMAPRSASLSTCFRSFLFYIFSKGPIFPDLCPASEDEEFFQGSDTESKEEAINKFLDGTRMEDQECSGFKGIDRLLGRLAVPAGKETRSMSHSEARAGEFLPDMDAEEQRRFTPSELLIYKHALKYWYIL